MHAPDWLTARPIAHRGLHVKEKGLIENTLAAAEAAIAKNYAIECDVRRTKDGEAVVFHDAALGRLTKAEGRVDQFSARELSLLSYRDCDETIATLVTFLERVAGRVPVVIDVKSHYDGDMRLADSVMAAAAKYPGPVCFKSFDPEILIYLRRAGASCPVGIVARGGYDDEEWTALPLERRARFIDFRDFPLVRPDFLSWNHGDLPHAVPTLCREGMGMPVMTWAVGSGEAWLQARPWADQVIFEGFEP